MLKKALKITIFCVSVLLLFSSCSGKVQNCKIFPKIEMGSEKNSESDDKKIGTRQKIENMIENRTTSAQASCNF